MRRLTDTGRLPVKCTGCLKSNVSSSSEFGPIVLPSKLFLPIFESEETGVARRTFVGLVFLNF